MGRERGRGCGDVGSGRGLGSGFLMGKNFKKKGGRG